MKVNEHNQPDNGSDTIVPKFAPAYTMAANVDLSKGGTHALSILCILGKVTPSPTPVSIRTNFKIYSYIPIIFKLQASKYIPTTRAGTER